MRRAALLWGLVVAAGAARAASFREAVEADWLLQDRVRTAARVRARRGRPAVSPKQDALGAVDGRKTGKWGFHTVNDKSPWWQVDLQKPHPLDRVVVYNRCDGGCPSRNRFTELKLSLDGKAWATVYSHKGAAPFGGKGVGKPLTVTLAGKTARFVRLQHPTPTWFHLDEVEVYPAANPKKNIALWKPANQSSSSQWSVLHEKRGLSPSPQGTVPFSAPFAILLERGQRLAADLLAATGAGTGFQPVAHRQDACATKIKGLAGQFEAVAARVKALPKTASPEARRALYLELRWAVRRLALSNPLLDFDRIFLTKRRPASFTHMSDQYYGWWSRAGGGLHLLSDYRGDEPKLADITPKLPEGSYLRPDLSYDATRIVFAHCRFYPQMRGMRNKTDKRSIPDDAFYHVYEMALDGTGLRQLTRGRYDDFDARYLPDGRIVFLSTRRGQFMQCGRASAAATVKNPYLPDSYVRCGGGNSRPVAIYTLHVMDRDGGNLRAISPFENFEWTPSVTHDGRILFARWDYIDRHNMPFMGLWSTRPDGSQLSLVYGNFTRSPHCTFEARSVPGSAKIMFTASGHHAHTAGSIVLLDTARGTEHEPPVTRLTPEVCFPEIEGWPATYYCNPYPLSETYYLVAWSPKPIRSQGHDAGTSNTGVYLADAFGNLELLHRDPDIATCTPIPLKRRPRPHAIPDEVAAHPDESVEGRFLLLDVYDGLPGVPRGAVKRLRIVGVPAKTQPQMNRPSLGATRDDPGKCVLGTVPVEPDGSAHFRVPAGTLIFFQALDAHGMAIQTMRTGTHAQPDRTIACIGCHEHRSKAPANLHALAAAREPARLTPGPDGSWPLRYDKLVQPVLDRHCVRCHSPKGKPKACAKLNLTPAKSYAALVNYASAPIPKEFVWRRGPGGAPGRRQQPYVGVPQTSTLSLSAHVRRRYGESRSAIGACAASMSPIIARLRRGHNNVKLAPEDLERLITWIDTYGQRQGHFSPEQERALLALRKRCAPLLARRH